MTDIEGSTRLWEQEGDAMRVALGAHDALLRHAAAAHRGVVVKTTGDGMLARFDDADEAVAATLDAQRAIGAYRWPLSSPLRARMAVHTGTAESREGDYFGPAVNRVARLMALGHGGQVLVSGVTAVLAPDRLGAGVSLLDLGEHRLRDLDQPEHVYQLLAPGLEQSFPPLRSIGSAQTNLPVELTSFVGREREQEEIRTLSGSSRLVTLIGVGGTGKTRLMLRVASGLVSSHRDGVWLAELAPVSDPALVPAELGHALGVREEPGRATSTTLEDYLRYKDLLLLIDNCEHLIEAVATLAHRLLATGPGLRILATSREALGIDGEAVFQVPSMSLPAPIVRPDAGAEAAEPAVAGDEQVGSMETSEAVRLFVERAAAAVPGFRLTTQNASAVAEICRRLDGIPLAIELAAARVNVLSPAEIAQRLGDRFRLLTGGRRAAVPRQQTLRALIDWSWDLLAEPDRRLLGRVSVFSGGWTLEAAAAVTGPERLGASQADDPNGSLETLDGLDRLVARSLISVDRDGVTRYRMLETIRQYAQERLVEAGESSELRARHLAFFLGLALAAAPALRGSRMVEWLERLDADADNLRAAADWAFEVDPEAALRLCVAMHTYWNMRAVGMESLDRLRRAVATLGRMPPPAPGDARDRAILASAVYAAATEATIFVGEAPSGVSWASQALTIARETGDPPSVIGALNANGLALTFNMQPRDAVAVAQEVAALALEQSDWYSLVFVEASVGVANARADPGRAADLFAAATDHAARSGNPFATAYGLLAQGRALGWLGRAEESRPLFLSAYAIYTEIGDRRLALAARSDLAHALRRGGALDEAEAIYRETIRSWLHTGNRGAIANQLEGFASLSLERATAAHAVELLGAAASLRQAAGAGMLQVEQEELDATVAQLRVMLAPVAFEDAWTRGSLMNAEQSVEFALDV